MTQSRSSGRDGGADPEAVHGMMDDQYWSSFSSDSAHYELGPMIGFGASAIVYSAVYRPGEAAGERECAIKVSSQHADVELLFKESRMLSLCRHPNLLRILAAFTLPADHRRIAFVTPLIHGGSLAGLLDWRSRLADTPKHAHDSKFHLPRLHARTHERDQGVKILPRGVLSEEEIKAVVRQVLEGLRYLHERGYIHRDIKAGNLLVEKDGTIMLADFGVVGDMNGPLTPTERGRPGAEDMRFVPPAPVTATGQEGKVEQVGGLGRRKSFVGTPNWMAPEVVLGQEYDAKADIWSLGMTILELAYGAVPRANDKANKVLTSIAMDPPPTLDRSLGGFSKGMKEFVEGCLVKDPAMRATAAPLVEHHWLKGAKKKTYLADALLTNVPPIDARQELRRSPSVASIFSHASSWNFDTSPSLASSPTHSSFHAQFPIPVRSPSTFSQFMVHSVEDFPAAARSHSRTSSRMPSVPPSPRVPLKQWAERTASPHGESWSRSASERGNRRSASMPLRRGQSMSFDQPPTPLIRQASPALGSGHTRASTDSRARRLPSVDGGAAMSPVVEASLGPDVKPSALGSTSTSSSMLDLSGLRIRTPPVVEMDSGPLSTSPDEMDLHRLDRLLGGQGAVGMVRDVTGSSDSTQVNDGAVAPTKPIREAEGQYERTHGAGHEMEEPVSTLSGGTASPHTLSWKPPKKAEKRCAPEGMVQEGRTKGVAPTTQEKAMGEKHRAGGWLYRRLHEGDHKGGRKPEDGEEQQNRKGGLAGRLSGRIGRLVA